eukprot:COSAG03_NODE_28959_length_192_cov_14.301075_1_plen_34_part_01
MGGWGGEQPTFTHPSAVVTGVHRLAGPGVTPVEL